MMNVVVNHHHPISFCGERGHDDGGLASLLQLARIGGSTFAAIVTFLGISL
jgi:hypothetical protein